MPGEEQQREHGEQLLVVEAIPVLDRRSQRTDHVLAGLPARTVDEALEVPEHLLDAPECSLVAVVTGVSASTERDERELIGP